MTEVHALGDSFIGELEPSLQSKIRDRAIVQRFSGGDLILSPDEKWTGIVLSGMARVFLTMSTGRQLTIRHATPSNSIGIGAILGDGEVGARAVIDSEVMRLDTKQLAQLAKRDATVALAIAREVSARMIETFREVATAQQGPVRQRLARQLLHFACETEPGTRPLVLHQNHEDLAEAIGSAREVVSRHLARFQSEKLVELGRGRITLLEPARLGTIAREIDE